MNKASPDKPSEQVWNDLYDQYLEIPKSGFFPDHQRKRFGLMSLGLSEAEAEKLCEPRKYTEAEIKQELKEAIQAHDRMLKQRERMLKQMERDKLACQTLRAAG